jgi:hypothetical protein
MLGLSRDLDRWDFVSCVSPGKTTVPINMIDDSNKEHNFAIFHVVI